MKVQPKLSAAQKLSNSREAAKGIAAQRKRMAAQEGPQEGAQEGSPGVAPCIPSWASGWQRQPVGSQLGVWSTPTQYSATARRSVGPDTLHTVTGHTVRVVAGLVTLLVFVLGIMLGQAAPTSKAQQSTTNTAQVTDSTGQGYQTPTAQENEAVRTARTVTGSQCYLMWDGNAYEVVCYPTTHTTTSK